MLYEIILIVPSTLSDEDSDQSLDKIRSVITSNNGVIKVDEVWAKKKLAYPILHHKHGTYHRLIVEMPSEVVALVNSNVNLLPNIIRSLVLVKPVLTEKQLKRRATLMSLAKKGAAASMTANTSRDKISLDELDSKLDDIIQHEVA